MELVKNLARKSNMFKASTLLTISLKNLIVLVQILALSLSSQPAFAGPVISDVNLGAKPSSSPPASQFFLATHPVETQNDVVHVEVQAFEINNEQDLSAAQEELLEKTKKDPITNELFILDVRSTEYKASALDSAAQKTLLEIKNSVAAPHKIEAPPITVAPPDKNGFFKRHYNLTLALVRFIGNTTAITTGLIIGRGIPVEHALLVGLLAGATSGAIQIKSVEILKWLSNSVLLVNTAKKMGLLPPNEGAQASKAEKIIRELEMYGRWASIEAGFLLVCQTAMSLLNIPIAENLLWTTAKSTLSQGVFDIGVLKAADQLEKINPKWNSKIVVFKNVSLFVGSGISSLAAIGAMVGIPFSNLLFITLTATGLILNFSPKLVKLKPVEQILQKWHRASTFSPAEVNCRALFLRLTP